MPTTWTVRVAPGSGVVSKRGSALLVARPTTPAQEALLDALLQARDEAVQAEPAAPGRRLARRVAGLVSAAEPDHVPPFVLLAAAEDGAVAALVVGDAELDLGTGEVLSGRDVATWVDRVVRDPGTLTALTVGSAAPDQRTDLQAGTVRGDGAALVVTGAPAPAADPGPAEPLLEVPEAPGVPAVPAVPAVVAVPEPAVLPDAGPEVAEPEVLGTISLMDEPLAEEDARTDVVPTAEAPASCAAMVLDDGTVHPLTGDHVLGREPQGAVDVRHGRATALVLADPQATLSRVHAKVVVQEGSVTVVDLGSANGSFVADPGDPEWTRLVPHAPTPVRHGTRLTVGARSLTFELPER